MNSTKHRRHPGKQRTGRHFKAPNHKELAHPESTGTESSYLKSLIDSHTPVTVTMKSGERFHGHIRYYDRYCFSIGLSSGKKKILLRKDGVSYITEE
jgi:sRNA-binding regulator protein Hfq